MKKKLAVVLMVTLTGLLFLAVGVLTAAEAPTTPPTEVLIHSPGYKMYLKGPVKFPHKQHVDQKEACTECHHNYVNGKNVWKQGDPVKLCVACHNPLKSQGKILKLEVAFHNNCRNCHRKLKREGKKSGPITCNKCHEKKS